MDDIQPVNRTEVRNKKKRNLILLVSICVLILISAVVLLYFVIQNEKALLGADQAIRLSAQGGFDCEYSEAQKLYPFSDGILKVTNDRIAYLTMSGNEVFSCNVNYANPQCITKDTLSVVFDADGYAFVLLNNEGVIYDKPTENKIKSAYISDSGICSVITDSTESYGKVVLYDVDGSVIMDWDSYISGYPLSCAFNSDSSRISVTTVNTNGAVCQSYVRVFSINQVNNRLNVSDYAIYEVNDSSVLSSCFYIEDKLFAFASDAIYVVNNDQLVLLGGNFGNIIRVNKVGNNVFIVYSDGIEQMNKLAVISNSGNTYYNSPVGSEVNSVSVFGNRYVLSIDKRIFVFDVNGNVLHDISVDEDVLRIGFVNSNKLVIVSTSGVHTVDF